MSNFKTACKEKFVLGTTSLQSGKADVKRRIKYMAKFRKPAVATVVLAAILISVLSACCLTNPLNVSDIIDNNIFTFQNPANGCRLDLVIDSKLAKSEILGTGGASIYFRSDLDVETIAKRLLEDNPEHLGYVTVDEKDVLLRCCNKEFIPYILITKRVKGESGNELDDVVFLECLGENEDFLDENCDPPKGIPNIAYSFYFPDYLMEDFRYENFTEDEDVGTTYTVRTSNPFTQEIKLIDSEDNFHQLKNFYGRIYHYTTPKRYKDGGGEILIEDNDGIDPLFKIIYNNKNKTVKFKPYPALAAESTKSVIYRLLNAVKRDERIFIESCFPDFTDEDYKNLKTIKDIDYQRILSQPFDSVNLRFYYFGEIEVEYTDGQKGVNSYNKNFEVEYFGGNPKITFTDLGSHSGYDRDYVSEKQNNNSNLIVDETLGELDLSDIDGMKFKSLPDVIYADDSKAIVDGDFGIIVYDLKERAVTLRVSYEYLQELGMSFPIGDASVDGKEVYIRDRAEDFGGIEMIDGVRRYNGEFLRLVLNVENRTLKYDSGAMAGNTHTTFPRMEIYDLSAEEKETYGIDENYVDGTCVEFRDNIVYAQCKPDWKAKNLSLVKYNKETGEKEEYRIFQS